MIPVCPLCRPDGRRRSTPAEIGDPSGYCTVNAHRELAVQALELAVWNEAMWAADYPTTPEEAFASPADQQESLL